MKTAFALIIILLFCTAIAFASVTPTISYQGRLTDATGAPVADGDYEIVFSIYYSESSSSPAWSSGAQKVPVSGGLFKYNLGSAVEFPIKIFAYSSRWLGIKVNSDPEMAPRVLLQSTPYAYTAARADTAGYATTAEHADTAGYVENTDALVHTTGDTITGNLIFDDNGDGVFEGRLTIVSENSSFRLYSLGTPTVDLSSTEQGRLTLGSDDDYFPRVTLAGNDEGGSLTLHNLGGIGIVEIDGSKMGDESINFPDDAINAMEILNESGIASRLLTADTYFTNIVSMQDILTVTITPPGAGYIHVQAHYLVAIHSGGGSHTGVFSQVDNTAGRGYYKFEIHLEFCK